MPLTQMNYTLAITNRIQMRQDIINLFTAEQAGIGTGNNASKYEYTVEHYQRQNQMQNSPHYEIFLKRPAHLNKGFDFTVNIKGIQFPNRNPSSPKHIDIISALSYCKANYVNYMNVIKPIIDDIFNCNTVVLNNINCNFLDSNNQTHPIEIMLLALKWLFMEQDITYWNYSGRNKLYNELQSNNLV